MNTVDLHENYQKRKRVLRGRSHSQTEENDVLIRVESITEIVTEVLVQLSGHSPYVNFLIWVPKCLLEQTIIIQF